MTRKSTPKKPEKYRPAYRYQPGQLSKVRPLRQGRTLERIPFWSGLPNNVPSPSGRGLG